MKWRSWGSILSSLPPESTFSNIHSFTTYLLRRYYIPSTIKSFPVLQAKLAGGLGSVPGLRRSPREGNGNPLQYSCLEEPMDRGAWWATVPGVERVGHNWQQTLRPFPRFGCGDKCCWDPDSVSFVGIPSSGLAGSYGSSSFNFLRNLRSIFSH